MSRTKFIAGAFIGLTLSACANDPNPGAAFGALAGAFAGSSSGASAGDRGAGGGGILGSAAGAALDEQDRQRAYAAQMQAIQHGDPGVPVSWRGADAGRYGTIVPGPAYQSNGTTCREYSHTIYIDRKPQSARGTACRNPDGSWVPVS